MPIDALSVLCTQLARDLLAIAKFLYILCILFVKRVLHHRVNMWHTSWSIDYFEVQRNNMQTWMTSCTHRRWRCRRVESRCCSFCSSSSKISKKSRCRHKTSAIASSAIVLLYLHIINITMHVICRASTDDDVRRRTTMDDNGRRRPLSHSYAVRLTYDVVRCVNGS